MLFKILDVIPMGCYIIGMARRRACDQHHPPKAIKLDYDDIYHRSAFHFWAVPFAEIGRYQGLIRRADWPLIFGIHFPNIPILVDRDPSGLFHSIERYVKVSPVQLFLV